MMLGCIADDITGATDLSSMLARAGLRVRQLFGTGAAMGPGEVDAIVFALKTRSIASGDAVRQSLAALRRLQEMGVRRFFFKYCSTFDSTAEGNIGPVAEALADALAVDRVWYCPAFPENGRTVYCGYLFVNRVPLHESGMQNHPLNPMRDSNLMRVLGAQTRGRVGLLGLDGVEAGEARHWIVDAIGDDDLRRVAKMAREHVLLTGGSAIARYWSEELRGGGGQAGGRRWRAVAGGQTVILAGSCSVATRGQIAAFAARGGETLHLDATRAAREEVERGVRFCELHAPGPVLIASGASAEAVQAGAAVEVERMFGEIARRVTAAGVRRLIVAGGETSGAVIAALGVDAIEIGEEVAVGVPVVYSMGEPGLAMVLKSGNFGGAEFFHDALEKLEEKETE